MKIAYLILAHNNPKHLQRLVTFLDTDTSSIFIHIDRNSNQEDFSIIDKSRVSFVNKRIPVYWGEYSQVEAILSLLRISLSHPKNFDYYLLISGSDFPIQPASYIENYLKKNYGNEFINLVQIPNETLGKTVWKLTTYNPRLGKTMFSRIFKEYILKMSHYLPKRDYKKCLRELIPYGGSTWWALSHQACKYINSYIKRERKIIRFYKNTICPDEMLFHTILGNSIFKYRIKRNVTFTDWTYGGRSPQTLNLKHLEYFKSKTKYYVEDVYGKGELLFARKFSDNNKELVMAIENLVKGREIN